jgi:hypothetical protein
MKKTYMFPMLGAATYIALTVFAGMAQAPPPYGPKTGSA